MRHFTQNMDTVCPEGSLSVKRKKIDVIRELVEGQQSASHLKFLLQKPFGVDGSLSAHELLAQILRSFTHTLSVLTSSSDEVVQNLVVSDENWSPAAASCLDRKSQDSSESRKRSAPTTNRRGCYKRRRTEQTRTVVSNTADDNHAWRKYGQKEILNFKFPRSYLRCSRKNDQGCRAVKQVQRIQESPEMYQITYIGYHTCKDLLKAPQVVTDSGNWESFLADSKIPNEVQVHTIKQEHPKEETPSDTIDNSLEPGLWSDLKDLPEAAIMPSNMGSDNADTVYSCSGSLDFGVDSLHFDSDFHFDHQSQLI